MQWLKQNIEWVITLGFSGILLILLPKLLRIVRVPWRALSLYVEIGNKIRERNAHLINVTESDLEIYKRQSIELNQANAALRLALVDEAEKVKRRDDVNDQDRITIRLLKARLKEHHIEFDDIDQTVRKLMTEKWM